MIVTLPFLLMHSYSLSNDVSNEMLYNNDFSVPKDKIADGWSIWSPLWSKSACDIELVPGGVLMNSPNNQYAVGGIYQVVQGIEAGKSYRVQAECEIYSVPIPYQSVLVRVAWLKQGNLVDPASMLVRGPIMLDNCRAFFDDTLIAHPNSDGAKISLEAKWLRGGSVIWKKVSLTPSSPIPPRRVKIGTVYLRPSNSTPERNIELFCQQIDKAGELGLDIVCLGEAITNIGTSNSLIDCAETIPGRSTMKLGESAKKNKIWVVAGLLERVGDRIYNTAVLLDRSGNIAGKYRKVHLPREEWIQGVTPGNDYPVFQTDFGKIAIQICYDWFFPETATIFALRGAEIIFAPTWGNTLPDHDGIADGETVFRVRARDNGVYMVPSVYDGNSLIIDPMGRILASNNGKEGVFWAEVDLNKREQFEWVGYWRSIGPRHRMIDTYEQLLHAPEKPTY